MGWFISEALGEMLKTGGGYVISAVMLLIYINNQRTIKSLTNSLLDMTEKSIRAQEKTIGVLSHFRENIRDITSELSDVSQRISIPEDFRPVPMVSKPIDATAEVKAVKGDIDE